MSDPLNARPAGEQDVAEHTHHWLIGDQEGPASPAVCKECGERREFSNSFTRRKSSWITRSASSEQNTPKST
jgi:hypothetical protein